MTRHEEEMAEDIESILEIALGGPNGDVGVFFFSYSEYERAGLVICHRDHYGNFCTSTLAFDLPGMDEAFPGRPLWNVDSYDPISISGARGGTDSVICKTCGLHGYIREGMWFPIP